MMKKSIRRGLPITLCGAPEQIISPANPVRTIGVLGADYPNVPAQLKVAEGERIARGAPLFHDRKRPAIVFAAPASGTVVNIDLGAKRRLTSITIAVEDGQGKKFDVPGTPDRAAVQSLLMESGLWPSFRTRPFGRIPDPNSVPDAIFVTALDTNPHAVDANIVLAQHSDTFDSGVDYIKALTKGPVFVCQSPGTDLVPEDNQVQNVHFAGVHPAGLAGTHIHYLLPLHGKNRVWQIHYQDVIAIGRLVQSGELFAERVVALAGPAVKRPRLVNIIAGADLNDLLCNELKQGAKHIVSGPSISGRESQYLGRYHWQVTALHKKTSSVRPRWLKSFAAPKLPTPVVPTEALEHALGPSIPVVPLVRALSVGDTETAARLGCAELLEEDVALLTYATGGAQDFSVLLRQTLNELEGAR